MNVVTFDMATELVVSSVTMNSSSLTFSQSNYELNINLPATLATGNSASVVITYAGSPPQAEGEHLLEELIVALSDFYTF